MCDFTYTPYMKKMTELLTLIGTGVVTGMINGIFGGGGGMLTVPMLTVLYGLENKKSHATAILIILPVCIVSGLIYAALGNFKLSVGLPVTLGVIVGGILGAVLLKKLPSFWVGIIFSFIMFFAGAKMLFF